MAAFERARDRAGISREETARRIDADLFTVAMYDEGAATAPDHHAQALGELFGVSPAFVQRGDELIVERLRQRLEAI